MTAAGRHFGRVFLPDDRDNNHLMSAALKRITPKRLPAADVAWQLGPILDQGESPECVGYGTEGFLNALPLATMDGPTPGQIYAAAQKVDGIKGPHDGTTVRAAMQVLQSEDRLTEYVWAHDADTVIQWIQQHGTVVLGIPWVGGFDEPDAHGQMHLTGLYRGGHCVLAYRADTVNGRIWIRNSWGVWGYQGSGAAWLAPGDLDLILKQMQGEAGAAIERQPPSENQPEAPEGRR